MIRSKTLKKNLNISKSQIKLSCDLSRSNKYFSNDHKPSASLLGTTSNVYYWCLVLLRPVYLLLTIKLYLPICLPGCRGPSDCVMTGQTNLPTQCWLHLLLKLHHLSLTLGNQDLINIIWDLM